MTKETKEILNKAITDVGYWQWWAEEEGDYMVEFGGTLLYNEKKKGKEPRSSVVALCYFGNAFLIFLDNNMEPNWIDLLHNDGIDPPTMDPDGLIFDDKEYAIDLLSTFKKRHGPFSSKDEAISTINNAKEIVAGTCGDYGFVIGGDELIINGVEEDLTDEDIKRMSDEWWEYWKSYWKKRGTKSAYKYDYACEVTIPFKE